jgi:hypothetical protein
MGAKTTPIHSTCPKGIYLPVNQKEHIANLEQMGYNVPSIADSADIAARLSR